MPPQASKPQEMTLSDRATAAAASNSPITIPLTKPVVHGNVTYTELEFQPMTGRHLRAMPSTGMKIGDLLDIGGSMAAVPDGVIDELAPEDVRNLTDVVNAFLLRIHGTED